MGSLGVRPLSDFLGSNSNEILTATNIMKNTNQGEGPTSGGPQRISSTASRQPTESAESRAQRVVKTTRQSKVGHGESPKSRARRKSSTESRQLAGKRTKSAHPNRQKGPPFGTRLAYESHLANFGAFLSSWWLPWSSTPSNYSESCGFYGVI